MAETAKISTDHFGKTKTGLDVTRYSFTNKNGVTIKVIDFGSIISEIHVPDRNGQTADITLGFDSMDGYNVNRPYLGATLGRVAGFIANGQFSVEGKTYSTPINFLTHGMHGGVEGFQKKMWSTVIDGTRLRMAYVSEDGEEGFPGELRTEIVYQLTDDNEFIMEYTATTNKTTIVNLSNHAYFNLAGHDAGSLEDHLIQIDATSYLEINDEIMPTGKLIPVEGTPLDLRQQASLTDKLKEVPNPFGFVHTYVFGKTGWTKKACRVEHTKSGRYLEVYTTEPGGLLYSSHLLGEHMEGVAGKAGVHYVQGGAFCLEAQHFSNTNNHDNFPTIELKPGEIYRQTTSFKFGVCD
ncbi:hypothetical protein ScPMuIL_013805 [Solemya velum]